MSVLPDRVLQMIIQESRPGTWTSLQLVSKHFQMLVLDHQRNVESLDILNDFLLPDGSFEKSYIDLEQLTGFLYRQYPKLKHLGLKSCPAYLTWANLVQMSDYLPFLESLDLGRLNELPKMTPNTVMAIPRFRKLKSLGIEGRWNALFEKPIKLHQIHFVCDEIAFEKPMDMFRFLDEIETKGHTINPIKSVKIGTKFSSPLHSQQVQRLLEFLESHKTTLIQVEIGPISLPTRKHGWDFVGRLVALPKVEVLTLANISCDEEREEIIPETLYVVENDDTTKRKLINNNNEPFVTLFEEQNIHSTVQ